jgi:polysaccharide biosynthesis/export protein
MYNPDYADSQPETPSPSPTRKLWLFRTRRAQGTRPIEEAGLVYVLLLSTLLAGCARAAENEASARAPTPRSSTSALDRQASSVAGTDSPIRPDDLLSVTVFDVPEMSHDYRVRSDGSISLPLIPDPIPAAGLSADALARSIESTLRSSDLLSHPEVTVEVKESRLGSVAITGAVHKPQLYPVMGATTLLDVLARAEGLSDDAGHVAVIERGEAGRQAADPVPSGSDASATVVDLRNLLESGDRSLNVPLYPGDRVTVERAGVVYVVGAVNRAGGFTLSKDRQQITVLKALALAEDVKSTALKKHAVVIRQDPSKPGERQELPVDLERVLAGRAPDEPLQAGDILFVPDSQSQKALRRAAEAAVQITTGVIIWRR